MPADKNYRYLLYDCIREYYGGDCVRWTLKKKQARQKDARMLDVAIASRDACSEKTSIAAWTDVFILPMAGLNANTSS
jgi:hypothetical protein